MVITVDLPEEAEVLIKARQNIDFNTPLAKRASEKTVSVPLAKLLGIKPTDIFSYLKKMIGEKVGKGELIAERKKLVKNQKYFSDYEGRIKEIDHNLGSIIIAVKSGDDIIIKSFVKGEVDSVKKDHLEIKLPEGKEFEAKEISANFGGEAVILQTEFLPNVNEELIKDKVVFIEKLPVYDQIKIETLDARGIVSLYQLAQTSGLPNSQVKNQNDWKKIMELKLPYCIIDKKNTIIYFYK